MNKSRLSLHLSFFALMAFIAFVFIVVAPVYGKRPGTGPEQTWPSRTPVPPPQPTKSPSDDDDDNQPTPLQTASPIPLNTATPIPLTNTSPPTPLPTKAGISVPTAEPCTTPPTIKALGPVSVRQGPGNDYPTLGRLTFSETRIIIGRAPSSQWWLIELTASVQGWVSDQAVTVQGNISEVPIVNPPAILGNTPTPGPTWEPTRNPQCSITSVNPVKATATSPATTGGTTAGESDTPESEPTSQKPVNTPTPMNIGEENDSQVEAEIQATPSPTATTVESNANGSLPWMLGLGLLLVVAGVVGFFVQRRST